MDPESVTTAIKISRHNHSEGNNKYFAWIRTCLTVASGALALLVGLQESYVPAKPTLLWALQAAWCFLCATIITGLVVLRGESASCFKAANDAISPEFVAMIQRGDPVEMGLHTTGIPWYYRTSHFLFPWFFGISFVLMALFAILNVGKVVP